ncbi:MULTISPECIES: hypothetical protein [unclassified Rhizobium]|uniref:hypothetical protein n=1 Tax=unclassified Rhizobium TaxID=2613769 RepID=UPI000714FF3B|nr:MULTISPECIES: hypothetical protein [unclassified Rhizobium]KQS93931.1 hypothetical protein ASG50_07015 [Rhizobium sp. Leaf386]KQT06744.1 hypothetical protein ASG42_03370 [Rhizobium sp. Leaf391]KQU05116.1 hypothetical protein ASG68_26230 [Rhizobium sp. Leaf453]
MLDFGHICLSERPLIVCDIDEVVLEFLTPLRNFLNSSGHDLLPRSFKLHGNIVAIDSGEPVSDVRTSAFLEEFFALQDRWQTPADRVVETLADLANDADIVFLTAMAPRHAGTRRTLLDRYGLHYPLLASEEPKGPIIQRLHDARDVPLVFIDDILRNLQSVQACAPDCLLINLMANAEFRAMAPHPGDGIMSANGWTQTAEIIREHLFR